MATYNYDNRVTLDVWAYKSGVWTKMGQMTVNHSNQASTGGVKTFGWSATRSVNLGQGVQAIGLSIASSDNGVAGLSTFNLAQWTAESTGSGERSATPGGQTTSVTVTPK